MRERREETGRRERHKGEGDNGGVIRDGGMMGSDGGWRKRGARYSEGGR